MNVHVYMLLIFLTLSSSFLFSTAGCNVNITNFKGATPIMFAINLKKLDVIKLLLAAGADINQSDSSGCTGLHFIVGSKSSGRERIIPFLLHYGADTHTPDKKGITI